jgi:hypothetical protein
MTGVSTLKIEPGLGFKIRIRRRQGQYHGHQQNKQRYELEPDQMDIDRFHACTCQDDGIGSFVKAIFAS